MFQDENRKNELPLISVIVPIYGIERYLGLCIESILNQTYRNLEIILVDDGSPDRCPEICDLYASKDIRIKVIHKPNKGLASARKTGLEVSTGEYIGYVDGDDWIDIGFYDSLYTSIATSDADVVCAGHCRELFNKWAYFTNNISCGLYEKDSLEGLKKSMVSLGDFYRPGISTYVWNKLFKRELLYKHQMRIDDRITIGEDAAVTYPVLFDSKRVCVIDNCAYHYRQHEDSMLKKCTSFNNDRKKLRFLHEYLSGCVSALDPNGEYALQQQFDEYILGLCIMRSGGRLPGAEEDTYSTFNDVYYGKKVVIYSAGTFGQQLKNRFDESRHCNVVAWVDDDYWEYRRCCMDVDPVEDIAKMDFDYILVATIDCVVAKGIIERLIDCGISREKILTVECPEENRPSLLTGYLYRK